MKKLQKISMILVIAIIAMLVLGVVFQSTSFATDPLTVMNTVNGNADVGDTTGITDVASRILTFLQIISGVFAIIMIAVVGFNYIVETPDAKAELKKKMLPIIIGILLVFFATSIAKFLINMFN